METSMISAIEPINLMANMRVEPPALQGQSFSDLISAGVSRVNQSAQVADAVLQAVAVGEPVAPHQAMFAMEEAKMNLQLALQVRNKLVEGVQELMRMQI